MKNYIKGMAVAAMMLLALASCRRESDTLHNYSYVDDLTWSLAQKSYGEKFKILWEGLNSNYAIWDYEKEHGLDWDEVYDKYYPKFVELDTLSTKRTIKDDELTALLKEVVGPLHDGHMNVKLYNHMNQKFVKVSPGDERNSTERKDDYYEAVVALSGVPREPDLTYYRKTQGKLKDYKSVNATGALQIRSVMDSLSVWANRILKATSQKTLPTEEELSDERTAKAILSGLNQLNGLSSNEAIINAVNELAIKYSYLNINGVHELDAEMIENGIHITYALFEGNIAYLYFDSFELTPFLTTYQTSTESLKPYARQLAAEVADVWYSWFNAIQDLHNAGQLGGVIIDVRGNGGGMVSDYQYVLGALLPSGGQHVMDSRTKKGVGRYDYSPLVPQVMPTYEQPHVTVTEPIAVLANIRSVSMAEMTSMGATLVENAKLVGTRTWGGLCGLIGNEDYSFTYAGHIGVSGKTPVYVYCPCLAAFSRDGKILEGVGVTPDIEVHLDLGAWKSGNGPDSQLDRALQYITSGK